MKKRLFAAFFGASAAPLAAEATPAAIVAEQIPEAAPLEAAAEATAAIVSQSDPDPLGEAAHALAAALAHGADPRALACAALDAFARADFSALDLNGPHTRAGDRVSKKGVRAGRRMILAALAKA